MGISYAGVSLPVLTPEAYKAIADRIPLNNMCPWGQMPADVGRGGFGLAARKFMERTPQIGHLTWPTGASRWATGFFLATDAHLETIRENVQTANNGEYGPANLVIGDGTNTITASMYMLPSRPLLGTVPGSELWLLVLVDQRYFWWTAPPETDITLKYYSDTANPYSDLMSRLPGSPSIHYDTIDPALASAPPLLLLPGEAIPPVLDWYALCFGQHVVCDLDGTVHAYNVTSAQTITASNLNTAPPLIAGGALALDPDASNDLPSLLPTTVQINFIPSNYGPPRSGGFDVCSVPFSSLDLGFESETNGTTVSFTLPHWNPQGVLQLPIAEQWATAFYSWIAAASDYVFAGTAAWRPSGLESWISWQYVQSGPAGVSTRVHRFDYVCNDTLPATPRAAIRLTSASTQPVTLPSGYVLQAYPAEVVIYDIAVSGTFWFVGTAPAWLVNLNGEKPSTANLIYDCQLLTTDQNSVIVWGAQRTGVQLNNAPSTVVDGSCTVLTGDVEKVITFSGGSGDDQVIVAAASPTQYGVVTTLAQTLGGSKTFENQVVCAGGLEVIDSSTTRAVWTTSAHDVTQTFYNSSGTPVGSLILNDSGQCSIGFAQVFAGNDLISGPGVVNTPANSGFLYISTCPGTPTGTPSIPGYAAMVYDDAADHLWIYSPGLNAWKMH